MPIATSPRKLVPLASGDDVLPSTTRPPFTKRVFFCGVVVEGSENGRRLSQDIQDLVVSLGEPLNPDAENSLLTARGQSAHPERSHTNRSTQRKRALTDSSAISDIISELVTTERSYVKRLRILKHDYADPLRKFARNKDTSILPPYEAKILFGNVDSLLPVNEAFLTDLEKMMAPNGARSVGGIGDVAIKHFKQLRGFEHYKQYYVKREEAQAIFEREIGKKSSGFAAFNDRIKYSSSDMRNRVGLRELLMDPVQRVPRYTLMFRTMIKHMAPTDPQRTKLIEADEIASKIALAETDEQTKRAAIMYCLSATVDEFPPGLISNSRRFVDCIDVEDVLQDVPLSSAPSSSSGTGTGSSLHCTLFLFDDKLVIVKRPGNGDKGGRSLAGLDEMEKSTKAGGLPLGMKKSGMSCKGVVEVTDLVATDVGGPDIHLYLENVSQDQNDRWSGRPFRVLSVVHPPQPVNLDPKRTESEKKRFLENLWNVQAMYRTRAGQSVALCGEEREVEARIAKVTVARTYFNVYQRTAFLQESKKTKIVVHVDSLGSADPIPFGMTGPPFVVVRVQPMAGELSRYLVTSSDPNDEGEEDIVQTARVPGRIVQTIHQFGLFKFHTGRNSLPSTPTASTRSRAALFGLDAISRNLFTKGDFFGGSINGHKRSKSSVSRSSATTQTTGTGESSLTKFSHRSNSTATAATSVSAVDDDSFFASRPVSRSRKLLKRGKSPVGSGSEASPSRSSSRPNSRSNSRSRSPSRERALQYSGIEDDEATVPQQMDQSEWDLAMRLELARRNSQNQQGKQVSAIPMEKPGEATIYEEEPSHPQRPPSRDSRSRRSSTPTIRPDSSTPTHGRDSPSYPTRSASQHSSERRPFGPRCPSPLPPKSPQKSLTELPSMDIDLTLETTLVNTTNIPPTPSGGENVGSPLPRSKRQTFIPAGSTEATPKPTVNGNSAVPGSVEPLSIKKKTSVRTTASGSARKSYARSSPLSRTTARVLSPRRVSPQIRNTRKKPVVPKAACNDIAERALQLAQTAREDVESSRRSVKRIKLELDVMRSEPPGSDEVIWRPASPDKGLAGTPQRIKPPPTREAQERLQEMRQLIGQRQGEGTPRSRTPGRLGSDTSHIEAVARCIDGLVSDAGVDLARTASSHETLQNGIEHLAADLKEKSTELNKTRVELQNAKRQCEVVKSLLADATAEKEIMYEAFNEELDGMYNDANLPEGEAWSALSTDLRRTKETRNILTKENGHLKRRLAETEMQKEEWGAILRAHGLIP